MARLLVVDDDPDVNEMAALVLAKHGHDVVSAASGKTALTILENVPVIDLMLTDVVMPEMDGVTLSGCVEALRPGLPIVFVSGYIDGMVLPERANWGFVRKPWRANTLVAEVNRLLGVPMVPRAG